MNPLPDVLGDVLPDALADSGLGTSGPEAFFSGGVHAVYDATNFGSLTFSGSDVVAAENTANPGTRDMDLSVVPPSYEATGLDGQPCLRFVRASGDYGTATGYSLSAGDRPSIHAVIKPLVGITVAVLADLREGATVRARMPTYSNRYQWEHAAAAHPYGPSPAVGQVGLHQVDYGSAGAGAGARMNQGTRNVSAHTTGTLGAVDNFRLSHDSLSLSMDVDISLVVVTVQSDLAEGTAFAYDYVAPRYPTIGAALP